MNSLFLPFSFALEPIETKQNESVNEQFSFREHSAIQLQQQRKHCATIYNALSIVKLQWKSNRKVERVERGGLRRLIGSANKNNN